MRSFFCGVIILFMASTCYPGDRERLMQQDPAKAARDRERLTQRNFTKAVQSYATRVNGHSLNLDSQEMVSGGWEIWWNGVPHKKYDKPLRANTGFLKIGRSDFVIERYFKINSGKNIHYGFAGFSEFNIEAFGGKGEDKEINFRIHKKIMEQSAPDSIVETEPIPASPIPASPIPASPIPASPIPEINENPKRGGITMEFLDFIGILVLVIFCVKLDRFINLKSIFKPTKKAASHVKSEWDNS